MNLRLPFCFCLSTPLAVFLRILVQVLQNSIFFVKPMLASHLAPSAQRFLSFNRSDLTNYPILEPKCKPESITSVLTLRHDSNTVRTPQTEPSEPDQTFAPSPTCIGQNFQYCIASYRRAQRVRAFFSLFVSFFPPNLRRIFPHRSQRRNPHSRVPSKPTSEFSDPI